MRRFVVVPATGVVKAAQAFVTSPVLVESVLDASVVHFPEVLVGVRAETSPRVEVYTDKDNAVIVLNTLKL